MQNHLNVLSCKSAKTLSWRQSMAHPEKVGYKQVISHGSQFAIGERQYPQFHGWWIRTCSQNICQNRYTYMIIYAYIFKYTHQISCTKVAPRIHPSKDAAGNLRRWNTSQVAIRCGFPQPRCGGVIHVSQSLAFDRHLNNVCFQTTISKEEPTFPEMSVRRTSISKREPTFPPVRSVNRLQNYIYVWASSRMQPLSCKNHCPSDSKIPTLDLDSHLFLRFRCHISQ